MADKMKKYIIGPMPTDQFLDEFLPTKDIPGYRRMEFHAGCYDSTMRAKKEQLAYESFVSPSKEFCFVLSHNYHYF